MSLSNQHADRPSSDADSSTFEVRSIRSAFIRGVGWAGLARVVAAALSMLRYVVFARLLDPRDFGVVGAAAFAMGVLSSVTSPSFNQALIQQDDDVEPYLDTAWTSAVVIALGVMLIMIAAAHPLADFFQQPHDYRVFWALSPFVLLSAMQSPGVAVYYRRLDFRIMLSLNVAELATAFAVGLAGILYWHDWRGLVAGMLAGQAARTAVTHWYFPYRPRLRFDAARARSMFRFGRWMTGQSIAALVSRQVDNLAVAHLMGPTALGEYQMAFRAGELPAGELAHSMGLVSFPLSARLRGRPRERARMLAGISAIVFAGGAAYAAVIFFWGANIVRIALGPRWLGAVAPLEILALYGMFQGLLAVFRYFLDGAGTPKGSFQVTTMRAIAMGALVFPLTIWDGTRGTAAAGLISVILPLPLMLILWRRAQALDTVDSRPAGHPGAVFSNGHADTVHRSSDATASASAAQVKP